VDKIQDSNVSIADWGARSVEGRGIIEDTPSSHIQRLTAFDDSFQAKIDVHAIFDDGSELVLCVGWFFISRHWLPKEHYTVILLMIIVYFLLYQDSCQR
jgi:hypothetical protein